MKSNKDISIVIDEVKYNFRVGAVLKHEDKILIEQTDDVPFAVIPGGRVKLMEDSRSTIIREAKEELGIDISDLKGNLISVVENFFILKGIRYHELYFIYKFDLENDFGIKNGMLNLDSNNSRYYWKTLKEIDGTNLLPVEIKEIVKIKEFKKYIVRNI